MPAGVGSSSLRGFGLEDDEPAAAGLEFAQATGEVRDGHH